MMDLQKRQREKFEQDEMIIQELKSKSSCGTRPSNLNLLPKVIQSAANYQFQSTRL